MRIIERTEDSLRFDSQGGLASLAEGTGDLPVRDTNNLRSAFTRIDEDMRFHYLLDVYALEAAVRRRLSCYRRR